MEAIVLSEGIRAQYQILAELKRVEEKVARLQNDIERIPNELQKLQSALSTRRQDYDKTKQIFDTAEKKLRGVEAELREKEDKLNKAESKMMEVKTNEEYQAAMRENEGQKKEKTGLEEQILTLISEVEAQRTHLKAAEGQFKEYEGVVTKDTKALESDRDKLLKLLEEQTQMQTSVVSRLSPEVQTLYNRVAAKMKGAAIVQAENGMCVGCNMKMRPQLFNEVLGFKAIHRCPSCGRIVIIVPKDAESVATAT